MNYEMYMIVGLNVYYILYKIQSLSSNWHNHIIAHNALEIILIMTKIKSIKPCFIFPHVLVTMRFIIEF